MTRKKELELFRPTEEMLAILPTALSMPWEYEEDDEECGFEIEDGIAEIEINGPLDSCSGWWWDNYEDICEKFEKAFSHSQVNGILCEINSPGGVVAGLLECCDAITKAKAESGKPVVVIVNGMACSAAYALASPADKIVCPRAATVGSIGVIATRFDYTGMDKINGIKVAITTSGSKKAWGNPHTAISEAESAETQDRVQKLAGMMIDAVARGRRMTSQQIVDLQAGTYLGVDAIAPGLIDLIGTEADARAELVRLMEQQNTVPLGTPKGSTMNPFAKALGLPEGATEAQILEAIATLSDKSGFVGKLLEVAGIADGPLASQELLGQILNWRSSAEKLPTVVAELAKIKKDREVDFQGVTAKACEEKIKAGIESFTLTPFDAETARDLYNQDIQLAVLRGDSANESSSYKTPAFDRFMANQTKVVDGKTPASTPAHVPPTGSPTNPFGLTKAELLVCERLGVTPEAYAKTKSHEANADSAALFTTHPFIRI